MTTNKGARTPLRSMTRLGLLAIIPLTVFFGAQALSWGQGVFKSWADRRTPTPQELNATAPAAATAAEEDPILTRNNPWFNCGTFESLRLGAAQCEVDQFPSTKFEYGFRYNTSEPVVADCLFWNRGIRIVNRNPYFMFTDNPLDGSQARGGALFYTGTDSPDDNIGAAGGCSSATPWRHQYWRIVDGGTIAVDISNGCDNRQLFCRAR